MELQIFTPEQSILQTQVEEVYATGPKGLFGVLPGHAHYVTPLALGPLYYESKGKTQSLLVEGGYMEVFGEKVVVAADHVEKASSIDKEACRKRLAELDQKLGNATLTPEEFQTLLRERQVVQARLEVVG